MTTSFTEVSVQASSNFSIVKDNEGRAVCANLYGKQLQTIGMDNDNNCLFGGLIELTPEFSKLALENMHTNRKVNKDHVNRLCDDMLNNRWQVTGETIIFDNLGITTDSQHRNTAYLQACNILGETLKGIYMIAIAGVSPSSMLVLDSGKKRSITDSAKIAGATIRVDGDKINSKHQQIIKAAIMNYYGGKTKDVSISCLVNLIQKFADPIEYILTSGAEGKNCFCKSPTARGQLFLALLANKNDPSALKRLDSFKYYFDSEYDSARFANQEAFESYYGFNYQSSDAWPLLLRHEIEDTMKNRQYGGVIRKETALKSIRAIQSFLNNLDGPGTSSNGSRKPIPVQSNGQVAFSNDLDSIEPWNDNSYSSIFSIMDDGL